MCIINHTLLIKNVQGTDMVIALNKENVKETVEQTGKPVVVDVYASWCGPCQMMKPIFEQLSEELKDKYIFAKLNVDELRDQSIAFGVSSVPTFIFIKNGKVVGKEVGYMAKEAISRKISEFLG